MMRAVARRVAVDLRPCLCFSRALFRCLFAFILSHISLRWRASSCLTTLYSFVYASELNDAE
jgi:hypothetical protein